MRDVKFNNLLSIFYNRLRKEISDHIIYSHIFWNENNTVTQNISIVKNSIGDSVIRYDSERLHYL